MGKVNKVVRLSQDELRDIVKKSVDEGVSRYINSESEKKRKRHDGLLFRTKKLLENYTLLKDYAERAVCTLDEAQEVDPSIENMDVLTKFHIFDDDRTLHRQLRGINAVKFMLAHVDRMLAVYKDNCLNSASEVMHRRWFVIDMMYLDREHKRTTKEIAEMYQMELSAIQKDAKEARNDLTILFFGLDAMATYELRD